MCGINGFNFADDKLITRMNQATRHRGPDGTDIFIDGQLSLGHNLLAITESPHNSRQPFVSADKNYALVYNGEIYNYRQLRQELKQAGDVFSTDSDTEVLFKGLIRYGRNFMEKLDGMFAFAFYDKAKQELLLARDPSGIKPLYYYQSGGRFIFSSEIKGILEHPDIPRRVNYDSLNIFFILGHIPSPNTMFAGIYRVCPSQYLLLDLSNNNLQTGWFSVEPRDYGHQHYDGDVLRDKFHQAVVGHTQGLRPLGLYLSGGLDSSAILYEWYKYAGPNLRTYTTRFDVKDKSFNEDADYAQSIARQCQADHRELLIKEQDFVDAFDQATYSIEEPSWVPHIGTEWLLTKEASRDSTVIMNGSGGDELFLGYKCYLDGSRRVNNYYQKYPDFLMDFLYTVYAIAKGRIKPNHILPLHDIVLRWAYTRSIWFKLPPEIFKFSHLWDVTDVGKYLRRQGSPVVNHPLRDSENAYSDCHRYFWLADDVFTRADKIMMKFGLEGRFPLLARDIVYYANSLPAKEKMFDDRLKRAVRDAYKGRLPDEIVEKSKTGWRSPVTIWMNSLLGEKVKNVLSPGYYQETKDLFDFDHIQKNCIGNTANYRIAKLKGFMPIFSFQIWAEKFKVRL